MISIMITIMIIIIMMTMKKIKTIQQGLCFWFAVGSSSSCPAAGARLMMRCDETSSGISHTVLQQCASTRATVMLMSHGHALHQLTHNCGTINIPAGLCLAPCVLFSQLSNKWCKDDYDYEVDIYIMVMCMFVCHQSDMYITKWHQVTHNCGTINIRIPPSSCLGSSPSSSSWSSSW